MTVPVYNTKGEQVGTCDLPAHIFEVPWNPALVHQVVVSQTANRRQVFAHTKTRAEVAGGGRKPWAQKHTGRARHGSIRSPIWAGGGVAFGPRAERNFTKKINKKMRRKALFCVLSEKAKDREVLVVEDFTHMQPKTKELASALTSLLQGRKKTLVALSSMNQELIAALRNIEFARPIQARDLNALDLLNTQYLVLPKSALPVLEKTFSGKTE